MALINIQQRELHCKLVYYGMPHAGKTTCLAVMHSGTPASRRGELLSIATEEERSLFFHILDPSQIRGFNLYLHLYTVPGSTLFERTRTAVLHGADGVIFVADSERRRLEENVLSMKELARVITAQDKKFTEFPLVLQYHKRDLPDVLPVEVMDKYLRPLPWPRFESQIRGTLDNFTSVGVIEAFSALKDIVISRL